MDPEWQPVSWHWLAPVLLSSIIILPASAAALERLTRLLDSSRVHRLPVWLRWVLVLPAALAFGLLAEVVPRLAFTIIEISVNHHLLYRPGFDSLVWQFFAPFFFVLGGLRVTPSHRVATFFVLAGTKGVVALINLKTVLSFINSGGAWAQVDPTTASPLWWNATVCILFMVALAFVGVALIRFVRRGPTSSPGRLLFGGQAA